jgi:hypothetical protein
LGQRYYLGGTNTGWADSRTVIGEFGAGFNAYDGVKLTPFGGLDRVWMLNPNGSSKQQTSANAGLEIGLDWANVEGGNYPFGTTQLRGERSNHGDWSTSLSHSFENWKMSGSTDHNQNWSVSFGYSIALNPPAARQPSAVNIDQHILAAADDIAPKVQKQSFK